VNNKTTAIKVTLRPSHISKVKLLAKKEYEGNFSMALRVMIDKYEENDGGLTSEALSDFSKDIREYYKNK